jgi:uncharacterized protein with HEPN domain
MERDPRAWLWDMREAAKAIIRFIDGVDFGTYVESDILHSAVERKFEIIGEAMSQLAKFDPALARRVGDPGPIVGFRNYLIHRYSKVDHDEVWEIAQGSLPVILATLNELLEELGPP